MQSRILQKDMFVIKEKQQLIQKTSHQSHNLSIDKRGDLDVDARSRNRFACLVAELKLDSRVGVIGFLDLIQSVIPVLMESRGTARRLACF
jgi:hypothetical protein